MSKGNDKFLKIQTWALKVDNICCDGCQKKVKKVLHKIDGVYTSTIDADAKKVTVTGNVDPEILIEKLNKAGKHAELWSAKGWKEQNLPNKLQKLHLELSKDQQKGGGKAQKGGGGGGGKEMKASQPQQQAKGFKDLKLPLFKDFKNPFKKNTETGKSDHSAQELEDDDDGSEFDEELDEYDEDEELFDEMDESEEEDFYDDPKMMKAMNLQPNDNGAVKDKKGGGSGGKGGVVHVQNKVADGKKGGGGSKDHGGGGGGGFGKHDHGGHDRKNGGGNHHKGENATAPHGNPPHGGRKGGGSNDGVKKGTPVGQPNMMGQLGNMNPSMGLAGGGPAPGYIPGGPVPPELMAAGGMNPFQQQYLQALMQHQQQQRMMMNGQDRPAYPPMMGYGYGYGQPVYVPPPPPPGPGPYTMFSDENPNSCSIM